MYTKISVLFLFVLFYALMQLVYRIRHSVLYNPCKLDALDCSPLPDKTLFHTYIRTYDDRDLLSVVQHRHLDTDNVTVFTHGNFGNINDYYFLFDLIPSLVIWDYRGYGRSTGVPDERYNAVDLAAIIPKSPEHITLVAHSLGTNVVMNYLDKARRHGFKRPSQVILIHPFLRFSDVATHVTSSWLSGALAYLTGNMDECNSVQSYINQFPETKFIICYSTRDRITPARPVVEFFSQFKNIQLYNIGGEHHSILHNKKLFDILQNKCSLVSG